MQAMEGISYADAVRKQATEATVPDKESKEKPSEPKKTAIETTATQTEKEMSEDQSGQKRMEPNNRISKTVLINFLKMLAVQLNERRKAAEMVKLGMTIIEKINV